ncbi:MAG: 50S ribosomal protein L17 [Candidatus Bipolaricaulota bacterium]
MDHKRKGKKLASPSHQKQLISNLVCSLIKEEKIDTTVAKAKETRRYADKVITLAKQGTPDKRRRAFDFLQDKQAVTKLFDQLGERYQDRAGGYTRLLRLPPRRGDGAEMARLTFV